MRGKHRLNPILFFTIASMFWLTFGCAPYQKGSALVQYVNQDILGIAALENKALNAYAGVIGANYTSDTAVLKALTEEVIPNYSQFFSLLKQAQPETDEIQQLHAVYVSGAESILSGFKLKSLGLQKSDVNLIRAGNVKIEEGRELTERWRANLERLKKEYGVKSAKK